MERETFQEDTGKLRAATCRNFVQYTHSLSMSVVVGWWCVLVSLILRASKVLKKPCSSHHLFIFVVALVFCRLLFLFVFG